MASRRWFAMFLVVAVLLGACSGDDDPGADPGAEFDPNGVLRVAANLQASSAGNLDIVKTQTPSNFDYVRYVYDTLLRATPDGFEPGLAESVDIVDPSTVRIKLREGVSFSDGTPFDAEAVKAGLLRNADPKAPAIKAEFLLIESIDVDDETELTVNLSRPVAGSWTFLLASGEGMIVSPKAVADGVDFTTNAVGAGPFLFDEFRTGTLIRLVKNPDYYDADAIKLAAIEFVHVSDPAAGGRALRSGDVDVLVSTQPIVAGQLDGQPGVEVVRMEAGSTAATTPWNKISLCMSRPPFDDVRVREALSLAIDREAINRNLYGGEAELMTGGLFPEGHPFYDEDLGKYTRTDKEEARDLLAKAGYGPSNPLRFEAFYTQGDAQTFMEIIQQNFAEIGVTMDIAVTVDLFNEFLRSARRPAGGYNNQDKGIARVTSGYRTGSPFNVCQYSNPELEKLLLDIYAADQTTPSDEAVEIWREIQEIVLGDYLSWSGVFVPLFYAHSDTIGGINVWPNASTYGPFADVRYAYVKA